MAGCSHSTIAPCSINVPMAQPPTDR
jgi:hypothetical protein